MAQSRVDVLVNMLAVLRDSRALPALPLDMLEPILCRLEHRNAFARCGVNARPYFRPGLNLVSLGVLLSLEGFNVLVAVFEVVGDPCLSLFAFPSRPCALAYRHIPLLKICRTMS